MPALPMAQPVRGGQRARAGPVLARCTSARRYGVQPSPARLRSAGQDVRERPARHARSVVPVAGQRQDPGGPAAAAVVVPILMMAGDMPRRS